MKRTQDNKVRLARFKLEALQDQYEVLERIKVDLQEQIRRLNESVPENAVDPAETRDGFMAYGSYAQSIITRKSKLRDSLAGVDQQYDSLVEQLRAAQEEFDGLERVRAREKADQAEESLSRAVAS